MRHSVFNLLDHHPASGESLIALQQHAIDQARLAERLSFDALWIAEHHFQRVGTVPNPAVLLAAIARETQSIRLGPAVSVLPLHDPIQVAEDYALVDMLSGGRLNMGVGTGSQPLEFGALGVDFEQRRALFDAALAVLCERWNRASVGKLGIDSLNVAPSQSPRPPIYVATMHPEGAAAAGRAGHSMLTLVSPATPDLDEIRARLDAHREGLLAGGHALDDAEAVTVVFAHAASTDEEARRVGAPALGRVVGAILGVELPDPEATYASMQERRIGLFGSDERVREDIEAYRALGVGHLAFIARFGAMDPRAASSSLEILADHGRA